RDRANQFGIMKINEESQITTFHEKPKDNKLLDDLTVPEAAFKEHGVDPKGRTHLASMGIYVFNHNVLRELLYGSNYSDFGKEVIPYAISNKKVVAYLYDGYW
ncbi:MAG: glucose-1-phosphate adenylyltransferase, partial [Aliifodinibius sp.]|nr:glucose-1-phosphate adenylyltransferase [Fodinibius sp.]NIW44313.1 glucose-1-phosphate adenylyltransferase [Gammaproteobacteria bacterium]NIX02312.1 glucose-1-phosphate adenylyltransferase [Phycisphaerae bacterium]NIY24770.1 glucose-1-phosphate adenylyltransferase [Fodinibius sp.]